jgi:hypothetical protein
MKEKEYNVKLVIDAENVRIIAPSGHQWSYKREDLPDIVFHLAGRCVRDDASLCQSIADSLRPSTAATV